MLPSSSGAPSRALGILWGLLAGVRPSGPLKGPYTGLGILPVAPAGGREGACEPPRRSFNYS